MTNTYFCLRDFGIEDFVQTQNTTVLPAIAQQTVLLRVKFPGKHIESNK